MSIKKRMCAIAFGAIALTACLSFALSACNGNNKNTTSTSDKTYEGTLSTESYESEDEAARYCIEHDVLNDNGSGAFLTYAKSADLTKQEIDSLPLSAEEKASIISAERGIAYYSKYGNTPVTALSSIQTPGLSGPAKEIYILKFSGPCYKYFIPNE
jgi:hypothetical protein